LACSISSSTSFRALISSWSRTSLIRQSSKLDRTCPFPF
jgi:hypothetical protein